MKSVVNDLGDKWCPSCNQFKSLLEYDYSKHSKLKVQTYCRVCLCDKKKDYRTSSNYKRVRREWDLLSKYRLTWDMYLQILDSQGGKCPICAVPLDSKDARRAVVDHCHSTGKVRGVLCSSCNTSLGKFRDSVEILERAIQYLKDGSMQ